MRKGTNANMNSLRIGIIGARKQAQGIGQYLARHLAACAADVRGIVGTSPATIDEARGTLQSQYGLEVRGYLDMARMIEAERLEAVAICSPYRFHRANLQTALEHRQHVLCEKPLVFDPDRDDVVDARQLVEGFHRERRVLMVNQQWPYTLPGFDRCYPDVRRDSPLQRLEMLMAPAHDGITMIPAAVPHVASMLLALAPVDGQLENVRCSRSGAGQLSVDFQYVHDHGQVEVRVCLVYVQQQPRPAAYAINDCTVARRIELPGYQMYLQSVGQRPSDLARQDAQMTPDATDCVPLEDPLRLLAADFISRIQSGRNSTQDNARLVQNVGIVQQIYEAALRLLITDY